MHFKIKKDLELGLGLDLGSFLRVETLHALWEVQHRQACKGVARIYRGLVCFAILLT